MDNDTPTPDAAPADAAEDAAPVTADTNSQPAPPDPAAALGHSILSALTEMQNQLTALVNANSAQNLGGDAGPMRGPWISWGRK